MHEELRTNLLDAVNGYGQVVGLPNSESGTLLGSLPKIEELLMELANGDDREMASSASSTLTAIKAREAINGTQAERANPTRFAELTIEARGELAALREKLTRIP